MGFAPLDNIKKLCIFDLDGTLVKESSGLKLTNALREKGIFKERIWEKMMNLEQYYKSRLHTINGYDEYIIKLSKFFAKGLSGAKVKDVEKVAREVSNNLKYGDGCKEIIKELKRRKFDLCIISASPSPIVKAISLKLGINNAYGLEVHVKNGLYLGKCKRIMTSNQKKSIIKTISKDYQFSVGVGDTVNDMIAYSNLNARFLLGASDSVENMRINTLRIDNLKEMIQCFELELNYEKHLALSFPLNFSRNFFISS